MAQYWSGKETIFMKDVSAVGKLEIQILYFAVSQGGISFSAEFNSISFDSLQFKDT